ncbi:MAG: MarR family transcriptional regulator [Proteobacteria bacterium]|nr:MarR family transcriptional regulator [Pseudomonadota bacterium]
MPRAPHPAAHAAIELRAAVARLNRELRAPAGAEATASAKLSALGQIYRAGALTPSELARRERVKLQSLTRLIAELQADGCIARNAHASDGRQSVLSLTRRGAALLTAEVHRREKSLADAIAGSLGAVELATLLKACTLMNRIADALDPAAASVHGMRTPS